MKEENRRPIQSRNTLWAKKISQFLANKDISPNQISVFSIITSIYHYIYFIRKRRKTSSFMSEIKVVQFAVKV